MTITVWHGRDPAGPLYFANGVAARDLGELRERLLGSGLDPSTDVEHVDLQTMQRIGPVVPPPAPGGAVPLSALPRPPAGTRPRPVDPEHMSPAQRGSWEATQQARREAGYVEYGTDTPAQRRPAQPSEKPAMPEVDLNLESLPGDMPTRDKKELRNLQAMMKYAAIMHARGELTQAELRAVGKHATARAIDTMPMSEWVRIRNNGQLDELWASTGEEGHPDGLRSINDARDDILRKITKRYLLEMNEHGLHSDAEFVDHMHRSGLLPAGVVDHNGDPAADAKTIASELWLEAVDTGAGEDSRYQAGDDLRTQREQAAEKKEKSLSEIAGDPVVAVSEREAEKWRAARGVPDWPDRRTWRRAKTEPSAPAPTRAATEIVVGPPSEHGSGA